MTRKLIVALTILALAAFGLAACGDDDETTTEAETTEATAEETTEAAGGGAGETLAIEADPDGGLSYTTGDLDTKSGSVTIEFDNPSSVPHDVRIEDSSGNDLGGTDVITGSSATATVDLEPGEYVYYCSVSGHREAGMEQKLTVE